MALVVTLVVGFTASVASATVPVDPVVQVPTGPVVTGGAPDQDAGAFIVVDNLTGMVLAGKNLHQPFLSASTAKTITALTAYRILDPNTTLDVSSLANARPPSRIDMKPSEIWTMDSAMWGLMVKSANDAAYVLAENTSGNLVEFAAEMMRTGEMLGMQDSRFFDPAGLDSGTDTAIGTTFVSVWDLAIAGRAVLATPALALMAAAPTHTIATPSGGSIVLESHNKLLLPEEPQYYQGAIGVKTGFTNAASGTFIAAATRNNRTLVVAILNSPDIFGTARNLFDWGFAQPTLEDAGLGTLPAAVSFQPGTAPSKLPEGVGDVAALQTLPTLPVPTTALPPPTTVDVLGSVALVTTLPGGEAEATDDEPSEPGRPPVLIVAAGALVLGGIVLLMRRPMARARRVKMVLDPLDNRKLRQRQPEPPLPFSTAARQRSDGAPAPSRQPPRVEASVARPEWSPRRHDDDDDDLPWSDRQR